MSCLDRWGAGLFASFALAGAAQAQTGAPLESLRALSIEQLADLQVSSVLKSQQALSAAPAAIYVVTGEEIRASGAQSLPEALRLAPNLNVVQTSASDYVVAARGLSGSRSAQNFSNKLLVLIDGRSVYNPLFSGVYWDMQHVPIAAIERIEVISGPGATLWGANAVNGVVNVITRPAAEMPGLQASATLGDQTQAASAVYGGDIGPDAAYRMYVQAYAEEDTEAPDGTPVRDQWSRPQAGFRIDLTPPGRHAFTVQGDLYEGRKNQAGTVDAEIAGRNLLARWTRSGALNSELSTQAYWDRTERVLEAGGVRRFALDIYDIEVQHAFGFGDRHAVVWGGGVRVQDYKVDGAPSIFLEPAARTLTLANVFAQDTVALSPSLRLTLGVKAEDLPYTGLEVQPSARLSWTPQSGSDLLVWGAVSRAARAATPFDRDLREKAGDVLFLVGDPDFQPEIVTAYEAGLRFRPTASSTLSVSAFHNAYDELRSIELAGGGAFLPLRWGAEIEGSTHGVEAWGDLEVTPWWRLSASYVWFDSDFAFDQGASRLLGIGQLGDEPRHRASLKSYLQIGPKLSTFAFLRYVDHLPLTNVPSYVQLNARAAWAVTDRVEVSIAGANLLKERQLERRGENATPREVFAEVRLRY